MKGELDTSPPVDMCLNEPELRLLAEMASTPPSAPEGCRIVVAVDLGDKTGGAPAMAVCSRVSRLRGDGGEEKKAMSARPFRALFCFPVRPRPSALSDSSTACVPYRLSPRAFAHASLVRQSRERRECKLSHRYSFNIQPTSTLFFFF